MNPMIRKELRQRMRERRGWLLPSLYLLVLGAVVTFAYFLATTDRGQSNVQGATVGVVLFLTLAYSQLALLLLLVPIFSAGATQSKVRQASLFWDAAKSGADQTSRQTEEQTRDSYQGVISQIAQIGARKRAFESNRVSLEAAQAGYEAGTKTVVDVLTSRDALVQAELSYAQAKYDYLNDIVLLRLAAGTLDQSVIEQINSWLVEPASAAGSGGT